MFRKLQFAILLLLAAASMLYGQRPGRRPPDRPVPPAVLERWNRMPPEQRRRMLERLPPERRAQLQSRMRRFNSMSPAERERLREQYEAFTQLPQDHQNRARRMFRRFSQLPEDRRAVIRDEFENLRSLRNDERRARVESEEFQKKFNPAELQMLRNLARLLNAGERAGP